jgi:hypothetical protein
MDRAFDSFEKALIFIKTHGDWFDTSEETLKRTLDLYDSGFLRVTKERDSLGRRTLFINQLDLDIDKFNSDDIFRLHCIVSPFLSHEEESQLCGVNYVADFRGQVTMRHMAMLPFKAVFDFVSQIKITPLRYKSISIIGLPTFATQFLQMIKLALSDKMLKRLHVLNDIDDLWTFVEKDTMTEKYGGKCTEKETAEEFRNIIVDRMEKWKEFLDFEIDLEKAKELKGVNETVGSFRKLEID